MERPFAKLDKEILVTAREWTVVEHMQAGPLGCNCTILGCTRTKEAWVIDPGGDAPAIARILDAHGLKLKGLFHTHAHFDHLGATGELRASHSGEVMLHEADLPLWSMAPMQATWFGLSMDTPPPVDRLLTHDEKVQIGEIAGRVVHTPGHTPGSLCLHLPDLGILLAGDTLFAGSVGRTDLPGGSWEQLQRSIRERLLDLPGETVVIPGHGPRTTIGNERETNPFLA